MATQEKGRPPTSPLHLGDSHQSTWGVSPASSQTCAHVAPQSPRQRGSGVRGTRASSLWALPWPSSGHSPSGTSLPLLREAPPRGVHGPGSARTAQLPGWGRREHPTSFRGGAEGGLVFRGHGTACLEAQLDSSPRHAHCTAPVPGLAPPHGHPLGLPSSFLLQNRHGPHADGTQETGISESRELSHRTTSLLSTKGVSTSASPPGPGGRFTARRC